MGYKSLPKKYYENLFEKKHGIVHVGGMYNFHVSGINLGRNFDRAQDIVDMQVWTDVQKYMPVSTGNLVSQTNVVNNSIRGYVYAYPEDLDYGHYQYIGKKYVDPDTGIAGFYISGVGWRSRAGVAKVKTNEDLTYSQPNAVKRWTEHAYEEHKKSWVAVAKRALK